MTGHYGTVRRIKHYDSLHPMVKQLEAERVRRGWPTYRLDIEAGCCIGQYKTSTRTGRNMSMVLLQRYAQALGKQWHLT